jgi:BON domain
VTGGDSAVRWRHVARMAVRQRDGGPSPRARCPRLAGTSDATCVIMPNHLPNKGSTDRGGQGQSGFGAGFADDHFVNQQDRLQRSRGYDDRFQGRTVEDRPEWGPDENPEADPAWQKPRPDRRPSDEKLHELVSEAIVDDGEIDASMLEVAVEGGVVTLTGTVRDRRTKGLAEDCAAQTTGVVRVDNQLRFVSA